MHLALLTWCPPSPGWLSHLPSSHTASRGVFHVLASQRSPVQTPALSFIQSVGHPACFSQYCTNVVQVSWVVGFSHVCWVLIQVIRSLLRCSDASLANVFVVSWLLNVESVFVFFSLRAVCEACTDAHLADVLMDIGTVVSSSASRRW